MLGVRIGLKGQQLLVQGSALGCMMQDEARPVRAKALTLECKQVCLFYQEFENLRIFLPANELTRIRRKRREWLQGNRKLLAISSQILINSHSRKEKFSNSLILDK